MTCLTRIQNFRLLPLPRLQMKQMKSKVMFLQRMITTLKDQYLLVEELLGTCSMIHLLINSFLLCLHFQNNRRRESILDNNFERFLLHDHRSALKMGLDKRFSVVQEINSLPITFPTIKKTETAINNDKEKKQKSKEEIHDGDYKYDLKDSK